LGPPGEKKENTVRDIQTCGKEHGTKQARHRRDPGGEKGDAIRMRDPRPAE